MHDSCRVPANVLAAIEQNRRRLWALCYRMTGNRTEADDLTQEAIARAIERAEQTTAEDATGWLLQLTSRLCLDHLRQLKVRRRLTELVDPLDEPEWSIDPSRPSAENQLVLQEDIRFAIVVAL
jgi:RNA polymerase sigma-70 factor (ECF subfamily)